VWKSGGRILLEMEISEARDDSKVSSSSSSDRLRIQSIAHARSMAREFESKNKPFHFNDLTTKLKNCLEVVQLP
jgi:hypothetical protein